MYIRKAELEDINAVEMLYNEVHDAEERGKISVGWDRNIYPTRDTAMAALERGELWVQENDEKEIVGTAIINQKQDPAYDGAGWESDAPADEVMVLHTLIVSTNAGGKGYGSAFVKFYEDYAHDNNCNYLRMDTNERNVNARSLYKKLGYREADIVPCDFNGLKEIRLVLLEKKLEA